MTATFCFFQKSMLKTNKFLTKKSFKFKKVTNAQDDSNLVLGAGVSGAEGL